MLPCFSFHHIGIAVKNIAATSQYYIEAGYSKGDTVYDSIQNVYITFLSKEGMPLIELLEPHDQSSPIVRILEKNGVTPYHCCYSVPDLESAINELKQKKFIQVSTPAKACALNNKAVCFLYNKDVGIVELLEQ